MNSLTANEGGAERLGHHGRDAGVRRLFAVRFPGRQVEFLCNVLGLPGGTIADLLRTGMKWAAIGLVLLLMFRGEYSRAVRRLALGFAAVVMLSPIIQPWYILWFVPFLGATNRGSQPTA